MLQYPDDETKYEYPEEYSQALHASGILAGFKKIPISSLKASSRSSSISRSRSRSRDKKKEKSGYGSRSRNGNEE
jgi:hypothetical protein